MIVDAHVHLMPDGVRANPGTVMAAEPWFATCHRDGQRLASPDSLLAAMDEHGVDRAVCFTWPFASPERCREANDWLASVVREHPRRLTGFGVVQPADPDAPREVERCARLGLRGIGELNADAQGWGLLDARISAVVAAAVTAGLPWNLHCSEPVGRAYPGRGRATPDLVAAFADRHPSLQLICAHLGGGLPLYAHIREVARLCRRLYFDTAAQPFVYGPGVYRAVIDAVGADRLLLGTDHPLLDAPRYLSALADAAIEADDRARITGGNAAELLGL
ncbi:MAG: amidohydrolase family protein [Candidatus Dormibacteria bacterium]